MEYNPKLRRKLRSTKAYNNNTFLNSREARHIRVQCEIEEPGMRLNRLGINNMVTFFGSARTQPEHLDYKSAYTLAYKLGKWTTKHAPTTAISSGGGPGIMEATNKGAFESGAKSIGMGISLPFEQNNNEFITPDLDFEFHYFFTRKYWCVYLSKAYVMMPGGVGTMDELFELLTLIQTQKINKPKPIVLYNSSFWKKAINFDHLVEYGTISKDDLSLFEYHDDIDKACDFLTSTIQLT
tara:strand:+ start:2254 stop:2970 length:717 start_codon:yes stop_codon:yes gene_type:complete